MTRLDLEIDPKFIKTIVVMLNNKIEKIPYDELAVYLESLLLLNY